VPQFPGAIEGNFVLPDKLPLVVSFEIDAAYFDKVGSTRLSWYDTKGKLLGQQTNTGLGIQRFVVFIDFKNIEPIAKWRIEPVGND
jgi:hypothetical protein